MLYYESFPLICDFCPKLFGQFLFLLFFRFNFRSNIAPPPYSETETIAAPEKIATKKVIQLDGFVGLANLRKQVYHKAVKKGIKKRIAFSDKEKKLNCIFRKDF